MNKFRITVDTAVENTSVVHVGEEETINFVEVGSGLYLFQKPTKITNKHISNYFFLTLVSANKQIFTKYKLAKAELGIELHQKLGTPGYAEYFRILDQNIRTFPITVNDANKSL